MLEHVRTTRCTWIAVGSFIAACGGDGAPDRPALGPPADAAGVDAIDSGDAGGQGTPDVDAGAPAPIEILVDDRGVPHVYASTDQDLFYGYGYQLASDRLFQLEMFRRAARGARAEVLGADYPGSVGATVLQDDQLVRMFDLPRWGRADADLMRQTDPERFGLVQAWVAGINRRVAQVRSRAVPVPLGFGPGELDFEPSAWESADPFINQKMAGIFNEQSLLFEMLVTIVGQLAPDALASIQLFKPMHDAYAVPAENRPAKSGSSRSSQGRGKGAPRSTRTPPRGARSADWLRNARALLSALSSPRPGSNSWVVDGRFTDNGRPMLAGDPHLPFNGSGLSYAVHLNSKDAGGTFDVAGFTFVSAPGVFAGQTDKIIFSPTTAFADVMDMWEVPLDNGIATVGGTKIQVETRTELIKVRGGGDVTVTLTDVPGHGVIFPPTFAGIPIAVAAPGKEVLVGWTGLSARPARYFLELNRARSIEQFDQAVLRMPEMDYNLIAADASGITYRVGVEVPVRASIAPGREPWRLMDGTDPLALWTGARLGMDQLPNGRAEARGWIVTANNDPFGFTEDGHPENGPWYYGAFFDPGWRARRIENELARLCSSGKVTLEQMQKLQMDVHSIMGDDLLALLESAWSKVGVDPALAAYQNRADLATLRKLLVHDWDRRMARDSSGALALHAFAHLLAAEVIEDDITSLVFERVLDAAPYYILKVAALALQGAYPEGAKILQGGRDAVILRALDNTARFLSARFGGVDPSRYRWADMHVSSFDDAYGVGVKLLQVPTDGGENTVNVSHSVFRTDLKIPSKWVSRYGPIARTVGGFDADGKPHVFVNFPLGNVADRASAHFADALDGWVEGRYRKMLFERAEIEAATERRIRLAR